MDPFRIHATDDQLDDLRARLINARWPEGETVSDWSQGTPLDWLKAMCDHWLHRYDWRAREARLNRLPQFRMAVEGFGLHFVHARSPHPDALPLLLSHGWPGSIVEFAEAIPRLTDPTAFGGDAADAFHVVAPSLPGYGFSDKPSAPGMGVERIARLFHALMQALGHARYVAQGGDWGASITTVLGAQAPEGLAAIHVNMPLGRPTRAERENPSPEDARGLAALDAYRREDSGYSKQQSTRPQTIGYALVDSPVALAGWVLEKFHRWSDHDGDPADLFGRDALIDNLMLHWLPATGASAARLYWESFGKPFLDATGPCTVPAGITRFPKEIMQPPRRWCERTYTDLRWWSEAPRGGHFAAFERPDLFVEELRAFFRAFR